MEYVTPSSMLGLAVSMMNICTILVILRLLTRRIQKLPIGVDDAMMLASWVLLVAISINMITAVAYQRWGRVLPPRIDVYGRVDVYYGYAPEIAQSEQFFFVQEALFPLQLMFAKLSILFFIRRVFCPMRTGFLHWASWFLIGAVSVWGIVEFFIFVFQCGTRFSLIWDGPLVLEAQLCLPGARFEFAMGVTDAGLDLLILLLPLWRIFTLQMPLTRRLSVAGIFVVGGMTFALSLLRLAIYTSVLLRVENQFTELDESMTISTEMFWGMLEAGFAVATACMPSMQVLISKAASSLKGSNYANRYNYDYRVGSRAQTAERRFASPTLDLEKGETITTITGGHGGHRDPGI